MKQLGLALGAGGSRGIAHIGFLQALEEADIRPAYVTGSSMGAIVGACYCAGIAPAAMKEAVIGLKLGDIATFNLAPLQQNGLMKTVKARKRIVGLMGEKNFEELKIPFACVATDLMVGRTVTLRKGNVADAILASSAIPGAFIPSAFGKYEMLVDGGLLERVPTRQLKRMGAEAIVAIDVLGNLIGNKKPTGNLINTLLRCIDLMDTRTTQRKRTARRYVDLWLEPELGDMDQYAVKNLEFAYEKGYELGKLHTKGIKKLLH